jgi:hypothetical protein
MGEGRRILSIVVAVLMLGSFALYQESFAITDDEIEKMLKINDYTSKPTFGLSHESNNKIVDNGFTFNNKTFAITNNFHTPFPEQPIAIGEINTFEATVFSEHGLKVQEFIFGIPNKGEAHLGELSIEIWYDVFGEIQEIKAVQKSDVIDTETLLATHEKTNCASRDSEVNCDVTHISMVFLEPLQDKVMAIKAIDNMNRYQITYLNEGFDVFGESLNSMPSVMIPSSVKNEGLIQVTQTEKYNSNWITEDGRIFERNDQGSFKQTNITFERFQDTGEPRDRLHSGFGGIIAYEQKRATDVFDASTLISELPDYVSISMPILSERIDTKMKDKMLAEEKECLEYLKESTIQARW